jgi:transposase
MVAATNGDFRLQKAEDNLLSRALVSEYCQTVRMSTPDGRKLDHKTLDEIRIRAVKQVEAGESLEVVIQSLGLSSPRIFEWLAAFREGGLEALKVKPIPGRPRKLSSTQLRKLYRIVVSKNSLQLKFGFALWTRSMVRELIRDDFGVRLSNVSVGRC